MPDYSKLHGLMSHRITIEYDTGAAIVGYLSKCQPVSGPVQFIGLADAELRLADGTVMEHFDEEIWFPANCQTRFAVQEGPEGS